MDIHRLLFDIYLTQVYNGTSEELTPSPIIKMYFSKKLADAIRANVKRDTKLFTTLYAVAVLVRIVEVLALVFIAWAFVCAFLIAGGASF